MNQFIKKFATHIKRAQAIKALLCSMPEGSMTWLTILWAVWRCWCGFCLYGGQYSASGFR